MWYSNFTLMLNLSFLHWRWCCTRYKEGWGFTTDENGLYLTWKDQPVICASAWKSDSETSFSWPQWRSVKFLLLIKSGSAMLVRNLNNTTGLQYEGKTLHRCLWCGVYFVWVWITRRWVLWSARKITRLKYQSTAYYILTEISKFWDLLTPSTSTIEITITSFVFLGYSICSIKSHRKFEEQ